MRALTYRTAIRLTMARRIDLPLIALASYGFDDIAHGLQALPAAGACTALATDLRNTPLTDARSGADFTVGDSFTEANDHRLIQGSVTLIMKTLINSY